MRLTLKMFSPALFQKPISQSVFLSSSILSIRTFFCICCVIEMFLHCFKPLFLYFSEFYGLLSCLNLAKIRDTAPLVTQLEFIFQDNKKVQLVSTLFSCCHSNGRNFGKGYYFFQKDRRRPLSTLTELNNCLVEIRKYVLYQNLKKEETNKCTINW